MQYNNVLMLIDNLKMQKSLNYFIYYDMNQNSEWNIHIINNHVARMSEFNPLRVKTGYVNCSFFIAIP